jgi:hypothetical protein
MTPSLLLALASLAAIIVVFVRDARNAVKDRASWKASLGFAMVLFLLNASVEVGKRMGESRTKQEGKEREAQNTERQEALIDGQRQLQSAVSAFRDAFHADMLDRRAEARGLSDRDRVAFNEMAASLEHRIQQFAEKISDAVPSETSLKDATRQLEDLQSSVSRLDVFRPGPTASAPTQAAISALDPERSLPTERAPSVPAFGGGERSTPSGELTARRSENSSPLPGGVIYVLGSSGEGALIGTWRVRCPFDNHDDVVTQATRQHLCEACGRQVFNNDMVTVVCPRGHAIRVKLGGLATSFKCPTDHLESRLDEGRVLK